MKRKILILLGFAGVLFATSCNSSKTAQLVAKVNQPDGTPIYLRDLGTEFADIIDTAKVQAGVIEFTKAHPAGLYGFEVNQVFYPVLLGKGTVTLDASNAETPTHYEGENTEIFNKYDEMFFKFQKEFFPIKDQLMQLENSGADQAQIKEVNEKANKLSREFEERMYELIKQYPDNLYSIYLATQLGLQGAKLNDFAAWLDTWKGDYSNSGTMKQMKHYIEKEKKLAQNQPFLDFTAKDLDGNLVKLSDVAGKGNPVLLKLWASWCRPCRMSMPHTIELYEKFKDKGFQIFCVSVDENADAWKEAMEQDKITWKTNYISMDNMMGPESPMTIYNTVGIPYTVLIDGAGKIVGRNFSDEELEKRLEMITSMPKGAEVMWE